MKLSLLFFLFLISFKSFSQKLFVPDTALEKIFGTWQWVSCTGGIAGVTSTPAKSGITMSLEFTNEGIMRRFRNNEFLNEKKFCFKEIDSTLFNKEIKYYLVPDRGELRKFIQFHGPDTLELDEDAADGLGFRYIRKK